MPKKQVTNPINTDTAANIKAKLGAYLQDHPDPLQQQFVPQDTTQPSRFTVTCDQVLTRLWELAAIGPEITRGSLAGQVKALSMIVAIQGLIPDRRATSPQNQPAPPPVPADIYEAEWLRARRTGATVEPPPAVPQEEPASGPSSASAPPTQELTHAPTPSCAPRVPMADHVAPDTRVPFSIKPWRR